MASVPIVVITLLGLSWMLMGCGDNGDATGEATGPPASGETVQLDKAQVGETPTRKPGSLLWQKVDAGEWTVEEGLIANLRILAGKTDKRSVYGDTPVNFRQSDVLIRSARAYVREGEDAQARKKIRALLDEILINREDIEQQAVEVPEPLGMLFNGLFHRLAAVIPTARADDCGKLWKGEWDARHPDTGACAHHIEFEINGRQHRIYYPAEWDATGHRYLEYLSLTRDALRHTVTVYEELGNMRRIDAVLSFSEEGSLDFGGTASLDPDDEQFCDMYLATPDDDHEDYAFLVAHETFHCFQGWNMSDAFWGVGEGADWVDIIAWWSEGSAEYFADVAYPDADTELEHWNEFKSLSDSQSILELSYENIFFFQYLGHEVGNEQIIGWLENLPGSGSTRAQAAALAGWGDMQKLFHDFGRTYLDMQLKDAGGGLLFFEPERGPETTWAPPAKRVRTEPFVLHPEQVRFPDDRHLLASVIPAASPSGIYAVRTQPDGDWQDMPYHVAKRCDTTEDYQLLLTSVTDETGSYEIEVKLHETGEGKEIGCESCQMPGGWLEPHEYEGYKPLECHDQCWCANPALHSESPMTVDECHRFYPGGDETMEYMTQTPCEYMMGYDEVQSKRELLKLHCVFRCTEEHGI